ncbi:MAG: hypothetical protein Q8941_00930 [Bacteroidota bacterium]|nr:hypothetical protein [Bacteroidota bacterium]
MSEQNQQQDTLQEVKDIRLMMERSSRFISLSGLSGVAAGFFALAGAGIARYFIFKNYYFRYNELGNWDEHEFIKLKIQLIGLAAAVFAAAFLSAFYFTWKKSSKQGISLWNHTSRRLFWNMIIPLVAGGVFILGMLQYSDWRFISPACLIFYGLALVNASKYTLTDIRYLGYCEIVAGLINMQWVGYGLYFWALGFGALHIIYGVIMWWKYERNSGLFNKSFDEKRG